MVMGKETSNGCEEPEENILYNHMQFCTMSFVSFRCFALLFLYKWSKIIVKWHIVVNKVESILSVNLKCI